MTRSLPILFLVAAASISSLPVASAFVTTNAITTKSSSTATTVLPHTVLFSAHKSRSRSAYSGNHVVDGQVPVPPKYQQYQQVPQQQQQVQQAPPPHYPPTAATATATAQPPLDPYQQQQYQQYQQYQQLHPPQQLPPLQSPFQQVSYDANFQNYHPIPVAAAAVAAPPQAATAAAVPTSSTTPIETGAELPAKVGTTSYTQHSKPWFEDPRSGTGSGSAASTSSTATSTSNFRPISYQAPEAATTAAAPMYQPQPQTATTTATTTAGAAQTVPLPNFPVEMAPAAPLVPLTTNNLPLAPPPPPMPEMLPLPLPLPPPPQTMPRPGVARHNGLLTEQPTKAIIQGDSRRTWQSDDPTAQTSAVWIQAERPHGPLYASVKFRNGPSSTPQEMKVYSEDGYLRPLQAYFGRPGGKNRAKSCTIDVINTASLEFPISATISHSSDFGTYGHSFQGTMDWKRIQGKNAIRTYAMDDRTEFVKVNLETDGLPLLCNIEVLQGPGDVKQVIELRSDDGSPWEGIVAVPGHGASVIVRNVGPLEFPIRCSVENQSFD